jgi:hypothetical protein
MLAAAHELELGLKGADGMGDADGTGSFAALRMTAKNLPQQKQAAERQKQIPFGHDKQEEQLQERAMARITMAQENALLPSRFAAGGHREESARTLR